LLSLLSSSSSSSLLLSSPSPSSVKRHSRQNVVGETTVVKTSSRQNDMVLRKPQSQGKLSFASVVVVCADLYAGAALALLHQLWCLITSLFFLTPTPPLRIKHSAQQSKSIQYPETEYGTFTLGIICKDQKTKRSVGNPP